MAAITVISAATFFDVFRRYRARRLRLLRSDIKQTWFELGHSHCAIGPPNAAALAFANFFWAFFEALR